MRTAVPLATAAQAAFLRAQPPGPSTRILPTHSSHPGAGPSSSLSRVLPLWSVSNQLSLALSFIRGLRKLGFSLEFIKAEPSWACRPPAAYTEGLGSPPPPCGHHTLPQCRLPLGSQPGGPEEEAGRVNLTPLHVLQKGPQDGRQGGHRAAFRKKSRPLSPRRVPREGKSRESGEGEDSAPTPSCLIPSGIPSGTLRCLPTTAPNQAPSPETKTREPPKAVGLLLSLENNLGATSP